MKSLQAVHRVQIELPTIIRVIDSCEDLEQLSEVCKWINFLFSTKYTNAVKKTNIFLRIIAKRRITAMHDIIEDFFIDKNNQLLPPAEPAQDKNQRVVIQGYA